MPMIFTEEMVRRDLESRKMDATGTEQEVRERLAVHFEQKYREFLGAWEVRTGRPWTDMTPEEAEALVRVRPELRWNPGVMSRLPRES